MEKIRKVKVKFIKQFKYQGFVTFKVNREQNFLMDEENNIFFTIHCCTKVIIPKDSYQILEILETKI